MKTKRSILFIFTVLSIFALPQIGIDLYLPSMPIIQKTLGTTQFYTQLSISLYILTMGLTQLIYGPLSDQYGRKPIILIGATIFLVGNIISSVSPSIRIFLFGRIIQGAGIGAGFTVASAMLSDTFHGNKLSQMTSFSSMVYSLSPLLAPVIGGFIAEYLFWQSNFYIISLLSLILLLCILFFVKETNIEAHNKPIPFHHIFTQYVKMLFNVQFISLILSLTTAFGITISLNIICPFLYQNVLLVRPANYGILILIFGAAYFVGTSINSKALQYFLSRSLIFFGLSTMLFGSIAMLVSGTTGWFDVFSITLWSAIVVMGTGFVWPNCFAIALKVFQTQAGMASALIGSLGLIGTSVLSVVVSHFHIEGENPLAIVLLIVSIVCGSSFLFYNFNSSGD